MAREIPAWFPQTEKPLTIAGQWSHEAMVGVTGFEPATSWSRTKRATKLRYTPKKTWSALSWLLRNLLTGDHLLHKWSG
jgi:hypothetical protein